MRRRKSVKTPVTHFKIQRLGIEVKIGDTVLLRPPTENTLPFVARIEGIEIEKNDVKIKTRWYYRPEESLGGRRNFHGVKELFLSDHFDFCSVEAIEGLCQVHSFKNYVKLDDVGAEDFFCRFEYKATTGAFKPDHVAVYCVCEMPYNPDDLMVQCEACKDWFHPNCIQMTPDQVKKMSSFVCDRCATDETKNVAPTIAAPTTHSASSNPKVGRQSKRSRR